MTTIPAKIVRSRYASEILVSDLPEDDDVIQPGGRMYYYEDGRELFLLVRPGCQFRFVSVLYPLGVTKKDGRGGPSYSWHNSVRGAVEHVMGLGHTVYRLDHLGHLLVLLRKRGWAWDDC